MSFYPRIIASALSILCTQAVFGQGKASGQWRAHLPYSKVMSAATDGNKLFAACQSGFYTYDILKKETSTYSKVDGMADIEMKYIAHDNATEMTVLAYTNSNIDLFKNETFYNIPELKLKAISGDKTIYHIYIENGFAYLSSGVGILVLNLTKKEIKETYVFTSGKKTFAAKGMSGNGSNFYAVTDNGLYKTSKNNPNIQASSSWKLLDSSRKYIHTATALNKTFVATADSVFVIQADTPAFAFRSLAGSVQHLDSIENGLSVTIYSNTERAGKLYFLNNVNAVTDSFGGAIPMQTVQTSDGRIWEADADWGLRCSDQTILPNGPFDVGTYDILAENGKVYVAHGSYDENWNIRYNNAGVSIFENDKWTTYNLMNFPPFNLLRDAVRMAKDPIDNTLYIASQTDGLFYLKTDNTAGNFREDVFEHHLLDPYTYRLSGVAFDQGNNLWVTQTDAPNELMARSAKDGLWYKMGLYFAPAGPYWTNGAAGLIVDDYNQKWFFSPGGGGVCVYDDKNTLENISDDTYLNLRMGKGAGNLPDNGVNCIVNDKKGALWIGTRNGIGIINCPDRVIDLECETEIRVVQYDAFAGQLFSGENVATIAVDGANRKWVGTGNGVWLISEDANKIISRFTIDNSPLPSNVIQTIKVDPVTGDVYFGTNKGMVSYKGTATDGGAANKDVIVYPNPVKSDYQGTIAIKGLVDNADVRITDVSGQLIYRTKALGGQAIWNGKDYNGRRPQSGVFLIFASNKDGTETFAGKMVFIN